MALIRGPQGIHSSGGEVRRAAEGTAAEVRSTAEVAGTDTRISVEGAGAEVCRVTEGTCADTRRCLAVKLRTPLEIFFNYL